MKRLISRYDDNYYTHMLKLIKSIGGRKLKYNWLITSIEAYPNDKTISDKIDNDYIFLSNNELLDILEKEDFQWIWATFSAFPNNVKQKDILQYELPSTDRVKLDYKSDPSIQHPLANIEIDCIDSSYFAIFFDDIDIEKNLLNAYPKAIESIDSPEDYFTTWDDRTMNPTFEFSYHTFDSAFRRFKSKNILSVFRKKYETINYQDSLHIYQEYFDDFIEKYPYFDEICLKDNKKGNFSYFGMDNYYDREATKKILDKLKKQIPDHNKEIIKFLEKAVEEHDGFYIHGI